MARPLPSWNELNLLLFPDWIVTRSGGAEEFDTKITRIGTRERRNSEIESGWQRLTFSGALLENHELRDWNVFRALMKGAFDTCLVSNIRHRRLDNELIATGDGTTTEFQVAMVGQLQGKTHVWPVKYIDHNYPPRRFPDGRICWDTQILRVSVDGVDIPWAAELWDIDRNTGKLTFAVAPPEGAEIRVSGFFLTRCRFAGDYVPTEIDEDSLDYTISDGSELIEVDE